MRIQFAKYTKKHSKFTIFAVKCDFIVFRKEKNHTFASEMVLRLKEIRTLIFFIRHVILIIFTRPAEKLGEFFFS